MRAPIPDGARLAPGPTAPHPAHLTPQKDEAPTVESGQGFGGQGREGRADSATAAANRQGRHRELMTPRHRRILAALLAGPVTREQVDELAGASNGPDEVLRLRRVHGLVIPCQRKDGRDRDGRSCQFGVYHLTTADAQRAALLLREAAR